MDDSLELEIRKLRSFFWSERDPDGRGFVPLADAYRRAGDLQQAEELLRDGLERYPGYARGHVVAGWVSRDLADSRGAIASMERVLELDPDNVEALRCLAQVSEAGGDREQALVHYRKAAALDPDDDELARRIAALEGGAAEGFEAPGPDAWEPAVDDVSAAGTKGADEAPWGEAATGEGLLELPDEMLNVGGDPLTPPGLDANEAARAFDKGIAFPDAPPEGADPGDGQDAAASAPHSPDADPWDGLEGASADTPSAEPDPWDDLEAAVSEPAPADPGAEPQPEDPGVGPDPADELRDEPWAAVDNGAWDAQADSGLASVDLGLDHAAGRTGSDRVEAPEEGLVDDVGEEAELYTRTMGELYARQGLFGRAVTVYEHLLEADPENPAFRERLDELRGMAASGGASAGTAGPGDAPPGGPAEAPSSDTADEDLGSFAADEPAPYGEAELLTPFVWSETDESVEVPGSADKAASEYFDELLTLDDGGVGQVGGQGADVEIPPDAPVDADTGHDADVSTEDVAAIWDLPEANGEPVELAAEPLDVADLAPGGAPTDEGGESADLAIEHVGSGELSDLDVVPFGFVSPEAESGMEVAELGELAPDAVPIESLAPAHGAVVDVGSLAPGAGEVVPVELLAPAAAKDPSTPPAAVDPGEGDDFSDWLDRFKL